MALIQNVKKLSQILMASLVAKGNSKVNYVSDVIYLHGKFISHCNVSINNFVSDIIL